jgi:protein subunit release factor B
VSEEREVRTPMKYPIPADDDALLAECDVETFRAGGPGGQHQNVTDSAVRLRHRPSGVVLTSRSRRSQYANKRDCLRRLRARLAKLNQVPVERRPTKPSGAAKRRRLEAKRRQAEKKRGRSAPSSDDG